MVLVERNRLGLRGNECRWETLWMVDALAGEMISKFDDRAGQ